MSFLPALVIAAALLPLPASAQTRSANPAHADAPVPVSGYTSAFQDYRTTAEDQPSPDKVWRFANEEVQTQGSHAGHAPSGAGSAPSTAGGGNATGASQQAPVTSGADPHAGHRAPTNQGK
jgi:hypothetical protein